MKFDILGYIFLVIAIYAGQLLGPMFGIYMGNGGDLLSAFIMGIVVYIIFCVVTGMKWSIFGAILFALCVYASVVVVGMLGVGPYFGAWAEWGIIAVEALVISIIFSLIGPSQEVKEMPAKV